MERRNKMTTHPLFQSSRNVILLALIFLAPRYSFAQSDIPQSATQLWAEFSAMDKATPLETQVLKTWEQNGVLIHVGRFTVGSFRGEKLKLAGIYAYPKGKKNLPAIVLCHGGGQKASIGGPVARFASFFVQLGE